MSRVLRNENVKAISTLASGQDLLAVLIIKRYTTFTSSQNATCSNLFFFLWRVDYALVGSSRQGELRILRRTATRAHFVVIINKGASM